MLSLGQSPCAVEVSSACADGFAVNRCKASDAMAAMGTTTTEGIGIATLDCFSHGIHVKAGDLLVVSGFYASVWHAAHTYYAVEVPLGTLPKQLASGVCISMSSEQSRVLIEFLNDVVNKKDITLNELLDKLKPYLAGKIQIKEKNSWEIVAKVIRLAHNQTAEERLNLPMLLKKLLTNKDKLTKEVKDLTGVTPMTVLRNARLHQCRYLIQQRNQTIEQIRLRYGFSNRKDFNTRYQAMFGELPTETKSAN